MTARRMEAGLDGVRLSYLQDGEQNEPCALLLHGFGSNAQINWQSTGWIDLLVRHGFQVIAPDHRGHGQSQKFYDPSDYGPDIFARDTERLLDHLGVERADVIGFSMGARIAAWLASAYPKRIGKLVLSGMGEHIFGGRADNEAIAAALEADDPDLADHPRAAEFRAFAMKTGSDLKALAACIRPSKAKITPDTIRAIEAETLVCVGTADDTAGRGQPLVDLLANGRLYEAEGLGHHRSVGDKGVKAAVASFLS